MYLTDVVITRTLDRSQQFEGDVRGCRDALVIKPRGASRSLYYSQGREHSCEQRVPFEVLSAQPDQSDLKPYP